MRPLSMLYTIAPTPLGDALLVADADGALTRLAFDTTPPHGARYAPSRLGEAVGQLTAYFAGERTAFDLVLRPEGTLFQREVWDALLEIPHGETRTYGDLAHRLGQPGGAQAVGAANGANPLAVVIPCHRVIGADGSLTGYAGGLHRKRALLDLESRQTRLF
ncbi:MAG: methylated-DNA--[protein]-cysteine S-methyltransferase [Bacteroidota bacterium]